MHIMYDESAKFLTQVLCNQHCAYTVIKYDKTAYFD